MNAKPPRAIDLVTDHAVLRYVERVMGIDLEAVRAEIVAEGRAAMVCTLRNGRIRIAGGDALLEVKGGKVVTVKSVSSGKLFKAQQAGAKGKAR